MNKIKLISTLPHLRIAITAIKLHKKVQNEVMKANEISEATQSEFNRSVDELLIDCRSKEREHQNIGDGHFILEALKDHLVTTLTAVEAYQINAFSPYIDTDKMVAIDDDLSEIVHYLRDLTQIELLDMLKLKAITDDIDAVEREQADNVVKFPAQGKPLKGEARDE